MKRLREFFEQYGPLLGNDSFRKLILAGFISAVGSKISYFALLRKVYVISGGEITDLGFLALVQMVPGMLLGPFAGILVDRYSRKTIMIMCDLANGLIILSLLFIDSLSLIYLIAGLSSLVTTFRFPAQRALEPNLVKKSQLVLLNSFKASTNSLIQVIGSAIGGATVGFLGARNAFIVDSLTFFVSAGLIVALAVKETHMYEALTEGLDEVGGVLQRQWHQFKQGTAVLSQNVNVRMVFLLQIFLTFAMAMQGMLIYYFLRETLQLGDQAEQYWGYLLSALGVGGVVGSFFLGIIINRYSNRFRLFLDVLLFDAVVFSLFLVNTYLPLSFVLFSLLGITGVANQIIINTILQEEVEDKRRGRVFSLLGIVAGPISAFSVFVGTVGADHISARNVLLLAAGCEALIAIGLRLTNSYRQVETEKNSSPVQEVIMD